jgi:hypothetical protein
MNQLIENLHQPENLSVEIFKRTIALYCIQNISRQNLDAGLKLAPTI